MEGAIMDLITLSLAKGYANKVAAGFKRVEVQGSNLVFTLNDGSKATVAVPAPVDGKDGLSITNVTIDTDGSLLCHMSDGSVIDAGLVPTIDPDLSNYYTKNETTTLVNKKQDKLVSGTNIKSVNGESLLGKGDIEIKGGETNLFFTLEGEIKDTWFYTPSEREGQTIGSITYDIPEAGSGGYGFAIANGVTLSELKGKKINLLRWKLSPNETRTSGTMTFGIYPINGTVATKIITVDFTEKDIENKWVTNYLEEAIVLKEGETIAIQPNGNGATPSDIKIGVLRASDHTTTDKYINLYNAVPTTGGNAGNYITRLGLCVDFGYRGVEAAEKISLEDYVDFDISTEAAKSLNGLYYGYDFTDNTNGTPNFDTTALQGAWNNSNLSELGYAATVGFNNQVHIKKYYVSDDIMTTAKVHLTAQDVQMAFGSLVRTDGAGGLSVGSLVKFDFNKKLLYICKKTDGTENTTSYINISFANILSDSDLDFVFTVGRIKSRIFASIANYRTGETVSLKSDDISTSDFSPAGRFYDYLTFMQNSGSTAYWQNLYTYVPTNVKIAFMGDSITQGIYLPSVDASWVNILGEYYGNCVSSGRGGAKIDFIIDALNDGLIKAYNPQYVVVTVGTNEGNTIAKLQTVIEKIKEIGATPIINCVSQTNNGKTTDGNELIANVNKDILSLHQLGARFDIATGANNDPEAIAAAGVLQDAVHPNSNGHALMAERFKFDLKCLK